MKLRDYLTESKPEQPDKVAWTKKEATTFIRKYKQLWKRAGYKPKIVGSVAGQGWSYKDLDIELHPTTEDYNFELIMNAFPGDFTHGMDTYEGNWKGKLVDFLFFESVSESKLRNPFKRTQVKKPVYRASRSGKLRSRSPEGALYFADKPRTKEFGPTITKAFINISKPFIFTQSDIEEVVELISDREAIKILKDVGHDYREEMEDRSLDSPTEVIQDFLESTSDDDIYQHKTIFKAIKKAGFDGVITSDSFGGSTEYVVFSAKQVRAITLDEAFDTDVDIKVERHERGNFYRTEWKVDPDSDFAYHFFADYTPHKKSWELGFNVFGSHGGRPTMDTKGTLAVFSGVIKSFKMFLKAENPNIIWFAASRAKLQPIYKRFAQQIEKMGFKRKISKREPNVYGFYKKI